MALTKIGTDGVKDDAITSGKIPANAVNTSELADNAVNSAKLASNSVTATQIASNAVTANKIDSGAITNTHIGTGAINGNRLTDETVTLSKLPHGTSSNNGKFLRANNGADPTFETVSTDLVADTSPQLGGALDMNNQNIVSNDSSGGGNNRIVLGVGGDLQLYHDGNHSYIADEGTGNLRVQTNNLRIENAAGTENQALFTENGAVELYHDNGKKLETTSTGINISSGTSAGSSKIQLFGHDAIQRNYWGYGTTYTGIQIGRSDSNVGSSIFMGVDPSGNTSGAFGGYGQEIIFRNDLSFYHPNNANDNWKSFMRTGRFGDTGAVCFPNGLGFGSDTATANILDDYEEGTWSPAITQGATSIYNAKYTKIGNLCTVHFYALGFSNNTSSDAIRFNNLPFTSASDNVGVGSVFTAKISVNGNVVSYVGSSHNYIQFFDHSTGDYDNVRYNNINGTDTTHRIFVTLTYRTA